MLAPRRFLALNPEFDTYETTMQFRLTYEGRLEGNGTPLHKHEIRRKLHPQLRRLWEVEPNLKSWTAHLNMSDGTTKRMPVWQNAADIYRRGNYRYVPVAMESQHLMVGLDILFLRPEAPGAAIKSADIDNRLKTLFDALRMPSSDQELDPRDRQPGPDEDPFFVLLEDDRLVSHVSVETDILLEPSATAKGEYLANDARLIITVKLRPYEVGLLNLHFA